MHRKTKLNDIAVLAMITVLLASNSAMADNNDRRRISFAELDGDADGKLSLEEFSQLGARRKSPEDRFRRLDADEDGFLSETEFQTRRRGKHRRS